jgi:zinc D-Ala-D-Ala carboxypeptidase
MDWSKYPNFSKEEFDCKHTGKNEMKDSFMQILQNIRTEYNKTMAVTSGYRHWTHPVEARKGHTTGEHTQGACADIACSNGAERYRLVTLALKHGITRIGIAKNFIHLGIGGNNLPNHVIWDYQ